MFFSKISILLLLHKTVEDGIVQKASELDRRRFIAGKRYGVLQKISNDKG